MPSGSGLRQRFTQAVVRNRNIWISLYFGWFLIPLFFASLTRGFGWWDYFTGDMTFHYGQPTTWGNLVGNYVQALFSGVYVVRPTWSLMNDLQTLVFGGEFWLWYCLKWAGEAAAIGLAVGILKKLGCGWTSRAAVVALLAFHHASFTLMLHDPDGWLALGMLAQVWMVLEVEGDVAKFRGAPYGVFVALMAATLGLKETGFAFNGALAGFLLLWNPRAWRRVVPMAGLLVFWTWRLAGALDRTSGFSFGEWMERFGRQVNYLAPRSPLHVLDGAAILLPAGCAALAWRWRGEFRGRLMVFSLVSAAGMLLFTTVPNLVALRYGIPVVYLLSIPAGLAVEALGRRRELAAAGMVVFYPLFTAGSLYAQELAYQVQFSEFVTSLNAMEAKARLGHELAITGYSGDITGEVRKTVTRFFKHYGYKWYGYEGPRDVRVVAERGVPRGRFALLSFQKPIMLLQEQTGRLRNRLERVQAFAPGDMGTLERLTETYKRLDGLMMRRGKEYWYDYGAALPSTEPQLYVYTFREEGAAPGHWTTEYVPCGRLPGAF
ncbi:MAG: hypothetical protein LC126_00765 [Bryobacterales bacterium]|nr:hypothetical protein [Bryobacterales bacterium]